MDVPKLKDAFLEKYPKYGILLKRFETTNRCECTWENLTKANLANFAKRLQKDCARKSAKTYSQMFKAVLNRYSDVVDLPRGWEDALSVKNDVSQNVYLTEKEIMMISEYKPKNDTELYVKDTFLLGALTGARHSDYMTFTERNVRDGYLVYISKKTHIEARVPVCDMLMRILKKKAKGKAFDRELSEVYYNDCLRDICRKSGITESVRLYKRGKYQDGEKWEFIASHTGRRTFATCLYLRNADLYQISRLMGHSSVKQTEGYICCGLKELNPMVMEYFSNFK